MRDRPVRNVLRGASEAILLTMAVLAPWAFGSVDAWAELLLEWGAVGLAILGIATDRGADRARRLLCMPSLALGGLALLAMAQALPLPMPLVGALAPAVQSLRAASVPDRPFGVLGATGEPVLPPPSTLSLEPEAAAHAAAALAGAWIVFQATLGLRGGAAPRFGDSGWRSPATPCS